jgi:hypothetical protein
MTAFRQLTAKRMDRTNWASVADRWPVCRHNMENTQILSPRPCFADYYRADNNHSHL